MLWINLAIASQYSSDGMDILNTPLLLFVPFLVLTAIFLMVVIIRACMGRDDTIVSSLPSHQRRISRRRYHHSTTSSHSTASVEIQTTPTTVAAIAPAPYIPPPGYYADVEQDTYYPIYVPSYTIAAHSPLPSLRDPRRFQGLPGVAAPPPYPSPPSYNQISNYPELPSISTARLGTDSSGQSRNVGKKCSGIAPVE